MQKLDSCLRRNDINLKLSMKNFIVFLLKVGTLTILLSSLLPSFFSNIWFIDILANFKLQIVIVSILLFIINIFSKKSKAIGAILLTITFWNISFISNLYYPSKFGEINKLKGISIASINLLSSNNESDKVIHFIKNYDPDILILLEYNPKWKNLLSTVTDQYTFNKVEVRNDNFGIGYFSKIESEASILNFDYTQVPSIKTTIEIEDKTVTIVATHPFPPVGQERFNARNFHLNALAKMRKEFSENLIIVGDLNTSSYSKHFKDLLIKTNLKDSRSGFGILPTWPSNFKLLQTTLDHFLVSDRINIINRGTANTLGSDHLPIFMEFRINN